MAPPGGDPDPGVVQSFLDAVASCGWSGDHLTDPLSGGARYLAVIPSRVFASGQWSVAAVGTPGCTLSQDTYGMLKTATAHSDGSFVTARGAHDTLRNVSGVATPISV